jgi:hypothetical protein
MLFNFRGYYSTEDKKRYQQAQEEDLIKICHFLKTNNPKLELIKFEVFSTREGKQNADPHHSISRASARFAEMKLYRFWLPTEDSHFPHEITHLVAHTWAKPYLLEMELDTWDDKVIKKKLEMVSTSFMQEGLAIAVDDIVFKRMLTEEGESKLIDGWCREQNNLMPERLVSVINMDGFDSLPNKVVAPFTASFSKFLLKKFGLEKYKQMYITLKETNRPEENVMMIESVYQQPEKELVNAWKTGLEIN